MHTVFYVSDGTAITAEVFGHAVLSQFPLAFEQITIPFVETLEKARQVRMRIDEQFRQTGVRPILFHTIVDPLVREEVLKSEACGHDFLNTFVSPLEQELGVKAEPRLHRTHGMENRKLYDDRIEAVNFALANDDGITTKEYDEADIILIGVSRCGKTPTSLYLALQFGIRAANYPFIEQDMGMLELPAPPQSQPSQAVWPHHSAAAAARDPQPAPRQQPLLLHRTVRAGAGLRGATVSPGGDPLPRYQLPLGGGDQRQGPRGDRSAPPALLSQLDSYRNQQKIKITVSRRKSAVANCDSHR